MGRYEVTFDDYKRFTDDPATTQTLPADQGWGRGTRPVINVNWDDAKAYAAWLSAQTGKMYRLPSEAEWEYAARAGTTTAYSFGNTITCSQAVYDRRVRGACNPASINALARTMPVGSFMANAFGLFDMHGNVWEWVEDCYVAMYNGAPNDGSARTSGCGANVQRVARGGGWRFVATNLRSAFRNWDNPSLGRNNFGFRLVQDLNPSPPPPPPPPPAVPSAPTGLNLTAGNGQVVVSWTAVSGATSYLVYISTAPITNIYATGVRLVPATGTSTIVTGLTNGTQVYVRVTATNAGGESAASTEESATPQAPPPVPSAPTGLNLTAGNGQVVVSWTAVSGAMSYAVYHSTSPITSLTASGVTAVRNLTNPSTTVTGLTNGTQVYVRVTVTTAGGESAASTEESATPAAPTAVPGAPTGLTVTPRGGQFGVGQLAVSWTAVPGAMSYAVYISTSPITNLTALGVTAMRNLTNPSTTVTGLAIGVQVYVRVTVTTAGGESAASSEESATPVAPPASVVPTAVPGAPTNLRATASNQVTLSWTQPWTQPPVLAGYKIYISTSPISSSDLRTNVPGNLFGILSVPNITTATITNLPGNRRYYFRVVAVNSIGDGPASDQVFIMVPALPVPAAPTIERLTAGNERVGVRWNPALPVRNLRTLGRRTPKFDRFTIYYSTSPFSDLTAPGVNSRSFRIFGGFSTSVRIITGLSNDTRYYFRVTVSNDAGESPPSAQAFITPSRAAGLPAPTNLRAMGGNGQVALSWTGVPGIGVFYFVQYSTSPITATTTSALSTTVPTNMATLLPRQFGTRVNSSWNFRVTVINDAGAGPLSNEVSATPGPVP